MNQNMELMNNKEISSRIDFLDYEIKSIDNKLNKRCIKPDFCKEDGLIFVPGRLFGYLLPKRNKVPDICKDYCYYRMCLLEEQQNQLRKQKSDLIEYKISK